MSGEALGWARRQKVSGGLPAKAVLVLLADYCGADHACWPAVPTIARELETTPRTVQRALRTLETDGMIVVVERKTGKGRTTSNHITLDVLCARGGQGRGDTVSPLPPTERHPTPDTVSPSPPSQCHPQNPQLEPPLEPSFADAQSAGARAGGEAVIEAAFLRFMAAYPQSGREKTNWAKARTAFAETLLALCLQTDDDAGELLIGAAATYAASATLAKGTFGAVNAVEFLTGERWRSFLPGTAAAQAVASAAPVTRWAGPVEVWAAVCADKRLGEGWAASWLAPCAVEAGVVHPRNGVAADKLRSEVGGLLRDHGLTIGEIRKGEL